MLQIPNEIFGGLPYCGIGREGLLQHNVQLLDIHLYGLHPTLCTNGNDRTNAPPPS
jgi:hypothetical protein